MGIHGSIPAQADIFSINHIGYCITNDLREALRKFSFAWKFCLSRILMPLLYKMQ